MSVESLNLMPSVTQDSLSRSGTTAVESLAPTPELAKKQQAADVEPELSVEKLEAAVDKLNELMRNDKRSINFSVDEDAGKVVVRVVDQQTSELIRQIPTEETLKFAEHLEGMMGVIFNDKA